MCAKKTDDDTIVEMPTQEEAPTKTPEERLDLLEANHANPNIIQQVLNQMAQDLQTQNLRIQVMEGHINALKKEQNLTAVVRERSDDILIQRLLVEMRKEFDQTVEENTEK